MQRHRGRHFILHMKKAGMKQWFKNNRSGWEKELEKERERVYKYVCVPFKKCIVKNIQSKRQIKRVHPIALVDAYPNVGITHTSNHFANQLIFLPPLSRKNVYLNHVIAIFLLSSTFIIDWRSSSKITWGLSLHHLSTKTGYTKHPPLDLNSPFSLFLSYLHTHSSIHSFAHSHPSTHSLHTVVVSITEVSLCVTILWLPYPN